MSAPKCPRCGHLAERHVLIDDDDPQSAICLTGGCRKCHPGRPKRTLPKKTLERPKPEHMRLSAKAMKAGSEFRESVVADKKSGHAKDFRVG